MSNSQYDDLDHEVACFQEWLYRDLEGWFDADIACCDICYSDFLKVWPHAYNAEGAIFQKNSIDLETFYEGSKLQDAFTKKRFFELMKHIPCPWCGSEIKCNLYPYELPFEIVSGFKNYAIELNELAKETPFLMLSHPFAQTVLAKLHQIAGQTKKIIYPFPLYRARDVSGLKSHKTTEFCFSPSLYVSEGRYNHAGKPALYLGNSVKTCFYELREQKCAIAEVELTKKIKILDLVDPYEFHNGSDDLLNTLVYSALVSAPRNGDGNDKPEYIFSRFIADCARAAGFDGIKYPSTRPIPDSYNIALLNECYAIGTGSKLNNIVIYDGKTIRHPEK